MPSALNRSGTSIVLINFMVLTSNIEGWGWSLVKPWPVFGHTVAPLPPTPGITPTGRVRVDVVRAALATDFRRLEDLVRPVGAGLEGESRGPEERDHDKAEK